METAIVNITAVRSAVEIIENALAEMQRIIDDEDEIASDNLLYDILVDERSADDPGLFQGLSKEPLKKKVGQIAQGLFEGLVFQFLVLRERRGAGGLVEYAFSDESECV